MKKIDYIIVSLLILLVILSIIFLFRMKSSSSDITESFDIINKEIKNNKTNTDIKINKILTLVDKNQQNIEEIIGKLDLQLNSKMIELSRDNERQGKILGIALDEVQRSNLMEIEELKGLLASYKESVDNKNAVEHLLKINTLVESDVSIQQLLYEGSAEYSEGNYPASVKKYRKILDLDSSHAEALCYLNASLYYQNPGDGSNFSEIKNDLISLLDGDILSKDKKVIALNVLLGISHEEGNSDSINKYQENLKHLEEVSQ